MVTTVTSGTYVYEVVEDWAKLPEGWSFVEVAGVGVDSKDRVYVFNRGEHPMMVFDRDGNFLQSWGEGVFQRPHAVTMGPDDTIYCTGDMDHSVRKCTLDGKVLMTIGTAGVAAPFNSGLPFNRCTHVALSPERNDIYVSDGYCNARVHKYSPDGKLLTSWGESGTDPGQFNVPHNICADRSGYVYVADRENHRVQVFDPNGKFETQWVNMAKPCGMFIDNAPVQHCYIGELGAALSTNEGSPGVGPRVCIYDLNGDVLARFGDVGAGEEPGRFVAPHGITADSRGDIYVGEVSWVMRGRHLNPPRELRSLQKLVRKG